MTQRMTVTMYNAQQGHTQLLSVWTQAKAMLMAGHRMVLSLSPASKSREQEEKYHAMIGEVAKQAQHLGAAWQAEDWKRLLLDKFARETNRTHGKVIPNLDKTGVVEVGIQSRKFSRSDGSEFIEWLYAWGDENGIKYLGEWVDIETGEIMEGIQA
jgi:hypothetical protein